MRPFPAPKIASLLAACALLQPAAALTQDSRPRRVPPPAREETARPAEPDQVTPPREVVPVRRDAPVTDATPAPSMSRTATLSRLETEPTVRIGLATSARSVTISTAGQLLLASNETGGLLATPAPVASSRVRVEPRVFGPVPAATDGGLFRVEIASAADEEGARAVARGARELTGEAAEVSRDPQSNSWRVRVGQPAPRAEAEELRARLEEAGIATFSIVEASDAPGATSGGAKAPATSNAATGAPRNRTPNTQNPAARTNANGGATGARDASRPSGLRLASRAAPPTRGLSVYAGGAQRLLDSRAPVTFAAADEQTSPLRFNERPYRGRLEVFTNTTGTLTVVNVVALEDYVRGVVPNELSPGGYPAVEALKAQAVAARTYAVSNRGQFASAGFDLLPTIRSQVYGGKSTEHPLTDRAVAETRGVVATYAGVPVNALYTSTCGGHTEDAHKIFGGDPLPYLRARSCSIHLARSQTSSPPPALHTTREPIEIKDAERQRGPRDAALLLVHGLRTAARATDDWLSDDLETADALALLELVSRLARRPPPAVAVTAAALRPPGFATALAHALDGESRAAVLLDAATIEYLLAFRDAADIPPTNRADVALLLRDGHLTLHPDATLRPRQQLTRARALRAVAGLLEARGLLQLQKANARPSAAGKLAVRGAKGPERTLDVAADAHLFRAFGETLHAVRTLALVGGEPVVFHTDARGAVDYLEARPAPNGASAERFSPFTNWTATLTVAEAAQRLARHARQTGALLDLRVASRGASGRALDLEIIGASGTSHVRGGRIRSALGLREQLFVIDRRYDEAGRVTAFVFTGRGWGHGVGLCQVGAYGLARAGLTYEQILKHYYTGIELTKAY